MPARKKKYGETVPECIEAALGGIVLLHTASHPTRYLIMKAIESKPLYINQLRRRLGLGRRLITFHLMDLERFHLIETYLDTRPTSRTRRTLMYVRFAKLTPKGARILKSMDQVLQPNSGTSKPP